MKLFDFLKPKSVEQKIDISEYKFTSSSHVRFEKGTETGRVDDCWRGLHISTNSALPDSYLVTTYNLDGNHSFWGDNIQMTPKQMKIIQHDNSSIILRGFGKDKFGNTFEDYGITIFIQNSQTEKIVLHMFDRNTELHYYK